MTVKGRGVVKFSAYGGHFYIDAADGRSPPDDADMASNTMYEWITDMDDDYEWEVTTHHFKDGVPICDVSWEGDDEYHVEYNFDLPESLSMNWYDRKRLWSWD